MVPFSRSGISGDNLGEFGLVSRSGNIKTKRTLTPAEIGDTVRTTRKAAGLRQDELAGAAGVNFALSSISRRANRPLRSERRFKS